jgi:hypothetical protein
MHGFELVANEIATVELDMSDDNVPLPPAGALLAETALHGSTARDVLVDAEQERVYVTAGDSIYSFDFDGTLVERLRGQFGAHQMALVGSDLYVNLRTGGRVHRIDTTTFEVAEALPLHLESVGSLAYVEGRLWLGAERRLWSLDLATGAMTETVVTVAEPNLASVPGSPTSLLVWEGGSSSGRVHHFSAAGAEAHHVAVNLTLTNNYVTDVVASGHANVVVTSSGEVFQLSDMTHLPASGYARGGNALALSPALGGLVGLGSSVASFVDRRPLNDLPTSTARASAAFSPDGRRYFTGTGSGTFAAWDLAPHVERTDPERIRPGEARSIRLLGTGMGGVSSARIGATEIATETVSAGELLIHVPQSLVPPTEGDLLITLDSPFNPAGHVVRVPVGARPPGRPDNVEVWLSNRATIEWDPPITSGSSPIDHYVVSFAGHSEVVEADEARRANLPYGPGTWTASVVAVSADGPSLPGMSAPVVVEAIPPSPVRFLEADPGPGTVTVSWWAPAQTGTASISHYEVGLVGIDEVMIVPEFQTEVVFWDQPPGFPVQYKVRAVTAHGSSEWELAPVAVAKPPVARFRDVPTTHPFYWDIWWAAHVQAASGDPDGRFRPADTVSRQEMLSWLWRLEGEPGPYPDPGFRDVGPNNPFRHAIRWAASTDITYGFPGGLFRPNASVSRQEAVAWLWRLAGSPPGPFPAAGFSDVGANHPFAVPIRWAAANGVVEGNPEGTFGPTQPVTRQAGVAVLARLHQPAWE